MDEWLKKKSRPWLDIMVDREALNVRVCADCGVRDATWRCLDCVCAPDLCRLCCKASHRRNPLHRVEWWNGKSFQPAWLWQVGTIICLGHRGELCPQYHRPLSDIEDRALIHNNCLDKAPSDKGDHTYGAAPGITVFGSGRTVTFVHVNGFHHLPVYPCLCHRGSLPTEAGSDKPQPDEDDFGPGSVDVQFLQQGFFPASWKKISTVFTFELLKDFHLTKVEAKMSTENYCDILRRKTNFAFPDSAPVSDSPTSMTGLPLLSLRIATTSSDVFGNNTTL